MKWFWLSLFGFLTFLVTSAAIVRPDTVDGTLAYVGTYLAVIGWAIVILIVGGAAAGVGLAVAFVWSFVHSRKVEARRQRDGSFPLQEVNPRRPKVWYDPNQQVGSAAAWHPDAGWVEFDGGAGWDNQRAVAQQRALVSRVQAAAPGDRAIERTAHELRNAVNPGGMLSRFRASDARWAERTPKDWERAGNPTIQARTQLPGPVVEQPQLPPPAVPPLTLTEAVRQADRSRFVLGNSSAGEVAVWDLTETPHGRFHGSTQKGKTSEAIAVVAQAIAQGHQVIILDPRGFKNWHIAGDYAELVDARKPETFAGALACLHDEYVRRDAILAQHNAKDLMQLGGRAYLHRVLVVIEEYGAQRTRAQAAGTLADVDHYMSVLASEAAAAGVHLLAIDQRPTAYHPFVKANLGGVVVFGLPDEGSGKAAGYVRAYKLGRYEFAFEGAIYRSIDAVPDFDTVVRRAGPVRYPPLIMERSPAVHGGVQESVHGAFTGQSPEVATQSEPAMNAPTNGAPTTVEGWYEWTLDNYLPAHGELLQVDKQGRGLGIKDLAMAMAALSRGDASQYEAMKGTASTVAARIRVECGFVGGDGSVVGIDERIPPKKGD